MTSRCLTATAIKWVLINMICEDIQWSYRGFSLSESSAIRIIHCHKYFEFLFVNLVWRYKNIVYEITQS